MSLKALFALYIFEAELTNVDDRLSSQLRRVRREVPRLHPVTTKLNHFNILDPCDDIFWSMSRSATLRETASYGGTRQGRERSEWTALCRLRLWYEQTRITS